VLSPQVRYEGVNGPSSVGAGEIGAIAQNMAVSRVGVVNGQGAAPFGRRPVRNHSCLFFRQTVATPCASPCRTDVP
jgi:hypothetical protein